MTAINQIQLKSWRTSKKECGRDEDRLFRRIWNKKFRNTLGKARQRENPNGMETILALERGKNKRNLSPLARRTGGRVCQRLAERGFDFVHRIEQTDDVVYIYIHVQSLWPIEQQEAA